jgi:DNA primase catalytic subunit
MKSDKVIDKAELIVDVIMKHLNENVCNHNVREAMREIFQN